MRIPLPFIPTRLPSGRHVPILAAVEVALVVGLALQCARLAWSVAAPPDRPKSTLPAPTNAPTSTALAGPDPFFRDTASLASSPTSVAGYTLHGVRLAQDGGSAIIAGPEGKQASYRVGEAIAADVILVGLGPGTAELDAGGSRHRLSLPETPAPAPIAAPVATALPASATAVTATLDTQRLLDTVGLRAHEADGRSNGYELIPRAGGDAVLRAAGLQPGDTLLAVNGNPLTPERMTELSTELASQPRVQLTVRRGDQTLTLNVDQRLP